MATPHRLTSVSTTRVLWVNEDASFVGGCENYVWRTARLLRSQAVHSTLLYDPNRPVDIRYLAAFDAAFPYVRASDQLRLLAPDIVYVHRLRQTHRLGGLLECGRPVLRFFHDHQLFCPREHKYTAIGQLPCTATVGAGCYGCPGFVVRRDAWPYFALNRVGTLLEEQRTNQALSGFVVGSRYMARHVAKHGFDPERITTLPLYCPPPTENRDLHRDPDTLLFVGSLVTGKGLDVLLRAVALAESAPRLLVAGTGRQGMKLRRLAMRLGLGSRARFLGKLEPCELEHHYSTATCVVVPSRTPETFAMVGVEAMSHGAPVIASDVGGMSDWLRHEQTGLLVEPVCERSLAAAIDRLLGDPLRTIAMGARGRQRYERLYRPEHHINSLMSLFRRTISEYSR